MEQFFSALPSFLQGGELPYQVLLVIIGYLEGLPIVGSFAPGGTLAMIAGAYVQSGEISFWWTVAVLALGTFLGDLTGYLFGRFAQRLRFVRNLIAKERIQQGLEFFERRLFLILVFGRILPFVRSAPALVAGVNKVKLSRYLAYNLLGSLLWSVAGVVVGMGMERLLGRYAVIIIVGITIVTILLAFVFRKKR